MLHSGFSWINIEEENPGLSDESISSVSERSGKLSFVICLPFLVLIFLYPRYFGFELKT